MTNMTLDGITSQLSDPLNNLNANLQTQLSTLNSNGGNISAGQMEQLQSKLSEQTLFVSMESAVVKDLTDAMRSIIQHM